jgi:hypothetical protein
MLDRLLRRTAGKPKLRQLAMREGIDRPQLRVSLQQFDECRVLLIQCVAEPLNPPPQLPFQQVRMIGVFLDPFCQRVIIDFDRRPLQCRPLIAVKRRSRDLPPPTLG